MKRHIEIRAKGARYRSAVVYPQPHGRITLMFLYGTTGDVDVKTFLARYPSKVDVMSGGGRELWRHELLPRGAMRELAQWRVNAKKAGFELVGEAVMLYESGSVDRGETTPGARDDAREGSNTQTPTPAATPPVPRCGQCGEECPECRKRADAEDWRQRHPT